MESKLSNLAELVEQLPATDQELEALKAAQPPPEPAQTSQPGQPGRPNRRQRPPGYGGAGGGSKFTGPDPETAESICGQLLAGGRASLLELIGLIHEPGHPEFKNYKAEYLLHCLVVQAGRPGQEAQRRLLMETLASQLGNGQLSKSVRGLLARELQWVGDQRVAPALAKLLNDEELCPAAVAALAAIGAGVCQFLRAALPGATGKNRLFLVQNLGVLRDAQAVEVLRRAADDPDRDVRLAALWALANVPDAGSIDLLLKAADTQPNYERIKATQACLLLAEKLAASANKPAAVKIYTHLSETRTEPAERYVQEQARKQLAALGT